MGCRIRSLSGARATLDDRGLNRAGTMDGLQGDVFSRVVRGELEQTYGVEDAILNMRVIDALFESEKTAGWVSV